jgi:hypothetical protein
VGYVVWVGLRIGISLGASYRSILAICKRWQKFSMVPETIDAVLYLAVVFWF